MTNYIYYIYTYIQRAGGKETIKINTFPCEVVEQITKKIIKFEHKYFIKGKYYSHNLEKEFGSQTIYIYTSVN